MMRTNLLILLLSCLLGSSCSDDCSGGDAIGSYAIFFHITSSNRDIFNANEAYNLDDLTTQSEIGVLGREDFILVSSSTRNSIGLERAYFGRGQSSTVYFDFGNGDVDTLVVQNPAVLRSFSENLNCAEGLMDFYYNGVLAETWNFDTDSRLSWDIASRNGIENDLPSSPISIELTK